MPSRTIAGAAMLFAAALFALVALHIAHGGPLSVLDARVMDWVAEYRTPLLTEVFLWITRLHSIVAVCIFAAILAGALWRMRERRWAWSVVLVVPGGLLLNALLKHLFKRGRPVEEDPLLALATYSFPSGHTAGAVLLYGVLAAFLLSRRMHARLKAAIAPSAVLLAALAGASRIYLGVHYLSDVLAAACASLAWLILCLLLVHAAFPAGDHQFLRR